MARKNVNKSELIREYYKSNPNAGPTEIARAISEQGYPVSPAHVNQALSGMRKKRRRKGRGRPLGSKGKRAASSPSSNRALDQLTLAADFCRACGGVDTAIGVLNSLKQIASKL